MTSGYSGTSLPAKLGIKPGHQLAALHTPDGFPEVLGELPEGVELVLNPLGDEANWDVIILFSRDEAMLRAQFSDAASRICDNGGLWVAWPKKSSPLATELRDSQVRAIGLAGGLVDNKVCAIDEDWSGLRFVYRIRDRKRK